MQKNTTVMKCHKSSFLALALRKCAMRQKKAIRTKMYHLYQHLQSQRSRARFELCSLRGITQNINNMSWISPVLQHQMAGLTWDRSIVPLNLQPCRVLCQIWTQKKNVIIKGREPNVQMLVFLLCCFFGLPACISPKAILWTKLWNSAHWLGWVWESFNWVPSFDHVFCL